MNPNRRWVALAFLAFGVVFWILMTKFVATVMGWIGLEEFDFHLVGDHFTLTTMLGLLVAGSIGIYCYRHPTISTLSNEVVVELKKVEEPELELRFGEAYAEYKRRVPMFIPRPWRRGKLPAG